jgi:hypothetical protein
LTGICNKHLNLVLLRAQCGWLGKAGTLSLTKKYHVVISMIAATKMVGAVGCSMTMPSWFIRLYKSMLLFPSANGVLAPALTQPGVGTVQ